MLTRRYSRAAALLAVVVLMAGCAIFKSAAPPGATTAQVVLADLKTGETLTFATLDTFVRLEYDNRAVIQQYLPAASSVAEQIRRKAPALLLTATAAIDGLQSAVNALSATSATNPVALAAAQAAVNAAQDKAKLAMALPKALEDQANAALVTIAAHKGGN